MSVNAGGSDIDKVRKHVKRVLRKELAPTVTGAVGRVFADYIVRPYQQVCDEYVERS